MATLGMSKTMSFSNAVYTATALRSSRIPPATLRTRSPVVSPRRCSSSRPSSQSVLRIVQAVEVVNPHRAVKITTASYLGTRSSRDVCRSPSQVTFPLSRRTLAWPRVLINSRNASSTAARLVFALLLRIACRISWSSISMFVRMIDMCKDRTIVCIDQVHVCVSCRTQTEIRD